MTARRTGGVLPRSVLGLAIGLALAAALGAPSACNPTGVACAADDFRYCDCASGIRGYEQCLEDGSRYGACDCSGTIPAGAGVLVEAGPDTGEGGNDGGTAKAVFLAPCTNDVDCASNLCFSFNAYGPHCSQHCTKTTDCPAPSPGCSNMGVCKLH